jgi:hypothetical protein
MKIHNLLFIVLAVVAAISVLCIWFVPSVQDFMSGNTMWNGVRTFCKDVSAIQLDSFDSLPAESANNILISIPYLQYSADDLEKIYSFLDSGGTLLLADDYGYGNQVLEYLGVTMRFDGKPVLDKLFCYKTQWFPKIVEFTPPGDFQSIILNHATVLQNIPTTQVIAWTVESSYIDTNENLVWDKGETKGRLPVAAKTSVGKGTLVIVGDPSLMINTMINRADNFAFITQLVGVDSEKRDVLFEISHLSKTPLDVSKTALMRIREVLSQPYPLAAIILAIFIGISIWTMKIGGIVGEQSQNS